MRKNDSGQITVFLAIVMMAVLMLAGLLVDIARINAGKTMVKRAADSAARSLLAEYGTRLKEGYGVFAFNEAETADLQDRFEEYLACNLSIPLDEEFYKGSTDLFGFRVEKINVTPIYNLSENKVMKKQILEYMKYRAPEKMVEGFMEKLLAVRDVGKMSSAYKQKVSIDKLFGGMDKVQQKLKKKIDGMGDSFDKFINGFNMNGSWEEAWHSFNSLTGDLEKLRNNLDSLGFDISSLEDEISELKRTARESEQGDDSDGGSGNGSGNGNTAGSSGNTRLKDLENRLDSLRSEQSALRDSSSQTEGQLESLWNELRYSLTGDYIKSNDDAVKEIEKIVEKGKKAQLAISKLESYLAENFSGEEGDFSKDFREQIQTELDGLKELILDGQKAEEMLVKVGSNSSLLKEVAAELDLARGGTGGFPEQELDTGLLDMIKRYSDINYDYSRPDKGDEKDDPREGKAEAVKKFISEHILEDVNYETEGIDKIELPSFTKVITGNFEQEDEDFTEEQNNVDNNEGSSTGGFDGSKAGGAQYDGDLKNVDEDMDLFDEEGMFQENALAFIAGIGDLAAKGTVALRDALYLNEYIMGSFKNSVPVLQYGSETMKDNNLHEVEKSATETFYDSEVEYILHGQPSQMLNNAMTKAEILLVRFGLNTLHVYTDTKKKTMATSVATTVAGWWTGGAGIPIISNLIMCGWGMGESLIDLTDLMDGKSIPIYKMKGDWQLDIGLAAEAGPKTDQRLYFNYYDYLRLFLLTTNEDKKLDRIGDLIQLNIGKSKNGFRLTESYTYVRVEAEVSMKYLFITRPFIQKELKTGDGRYIYKVLVYEGY